MNPMYEYDRKIWNEATPEQREEFIRQGNQLMAIALPLFFGLVAIMYLTT